MSDSIQHIAIVMDGNRRWAKEKHLPSLIGHTKGVLSVKKVVKYCRNANISHLSLFAFSTENWKRQNLEVMGIFKILEQSILQYEPLLVSNGIRLHIIGNFLELPESTVKAFDQVKKSTASLNQLHLILAVNYGGRKEIINAIRKAASDPNCDFSKLTEKDFGSYLSSCKFPDPDLIIRTGGVQRMSNFYLWSAVYSELYFSDKMWPDFDDQELEKAIDYYLQTKRRFGGS